MEQKTITPKEQRAIDKVKRANAELAKIRREQNQLELERIFTDQQTGKDFNRPRYQVLKEDVLRSGDELIITEVDRLDRNKKETLSELQYFRD